MLSVYILCTIAGGVVLGASAFAGHDSGGDVHGGDDSGHHDLFAKLPFLSLRFWTWGTAFFGLTGALLTWAGTTTGLVPWLAGLVGTGSGWGASYVLGRLTREVVGVLPEASSHLGREGRLLLPLKKGTRSKVRLSINGVDTDLLAETDSDLDIAAGSRVLVVGMRDLVAIVESTPAALGAAEEPPEKEEP